MNERSVFLEALEIGGPAELADYLDRVCHCNPALRRAVDELLAAHGRPGSFMSRPAAGEATADCQPIAERPGMVLGPYKLMEQIGEGGMGLVFVAEQQQPVRRKVALKIIKPGMDSKQVIARFEAERQALALMDHQNIAKVFDAGTTESGRPYFVMELVHGIPITDYCDTHQLTPRERLELFLPVCHAIQHAHQKGVIHRDIKPSNILVTMYDDKPVPKVIDFGVAKAIEQRLTEKTVYTQFGTLVGTFEYMSPEQAEMNAFGVDTRSDVYALGVLLYELLTGTTPLERQRLREVAYGEIVRLIKEEEPPPPSTRLSSSGAALAGISRQRGSAPEQLTQLVRGELDWIVMRCLEKDRTRRYETANGLARDVEHYLKDEPVEACPPTAGYKLRKFARKNQKLLVTGAAFVALLLLGVAASAWQAVRATQAEMVAQANAAQAQEKQKEADQQRDKVKLQRDEAKALAEKLQTALENLRRMTYAAQVNLAKHSLDAGGIERARELLERQRPRQGESDLRRFEWFYLHRLCHSDRLTLKHTGPVRSVAFSPDGKRLASAGGGVVKVSDAQTGQELFTLKVAHVVSVVFSPDGKRLATGSDGRRMERGKLPPGPQGASGEVKVWDAQTGKELLVLKDSDGGGQVVFSPDGKHLARGVSSGLGVFGEVKVWDAQTGKETLVLKGRYGATHSVAFSPDGKRLASGPTGRPGGFIGGGMPVERLGDVKVWDARTGKVLLSLKSFATGVAFSPDGKRLAINSGRGEGVKVWDAQTGKELLTLKGDNLSVAFSPGGERLAGTSKDGKTVTVWDAQTGQELLTFRGHTAEVEGVAFSPDGKRLASASWDKTVKVWDAQAGQEARTFKGGSGLVVFSPDGKRFATDSEDKTVRVWDAQTYQAVFTLKGHTAGIQGVAFSPDGKRLASAGGGYERGLSVAGEVKVWDAQTGRELFTFKDLSRGARNVVFSPDGKRLGSAGGERFRGGEVTVWDVRTGQELFVVRNPPEGIHKVIFSPDGKYLAGGAQGRFMGGKRVTDDEVKVWDAQTGKEILSLKGGAGTVAFSPNGKRLACDSGLRLKLWDVPTGKEILSLKGHTNTITSVVFSPDGKRLASASGDKTVRVWDAQTGQEIYTLKGHTSWVQGVAFSPDGKRLASCSEDKLVKVWDAETGQELLTLKHTDKVGTVVFSPDGHRLASASRWDGTVKIWDATPLHEKR